MPKAGRIVINLSAGTAQYVRDMDAAIAKNNQLGNSAGQVRQKFQELGTHGVSGVQATSAALRTLEGGITNNLRAGERFLAQTLGLGNALKVAFPVFGALALGGILVKLGEHVAELYEGFKKLQEAPQRIAQEGSKIVEPLRLTNAELQVSNDKLENEIAKIQGRPQNGLKLALDEAIVASLNLSKTLRANFGDLSKLLQQENVGALKSVFTNVASTSNIRDMLVGERGYGGYQAQIDQISADYDTRMADVQNRTASSPSERKAQADEVAALSAEKYRAVQAKLGEALAAVNGELDRRKQIQAYVAALEQAKPGLTGPNEGAAVAELQTAQNVLREMIANNTLNRTHGADEGLLGGLKTNEQPRQIDEVKNKLAELQAKLADVKREAAAAGSGNLFTMAVAKGAGEAIKTIDELNLRLSEQKKPSRLTLGQITDITTLQTEISLTEAQNKASEESVRIKESMASASLKLNEEIAQENQRLQQNLVMLREHTAELQKQGSVVFGGQSAERQVKLNDFDDQAAAGKISPEEAQAKKDELQAQYDLQDLQAAFNRTHDQTLEKLQSELAILEKQAQAQGLNEDLAAAILGTQKQIEKIQDQQALAAGNLADGWNVFFRDLQTNTKSAAQDMHDVLGSAITGLNDELARALTGQRTSWSRFFFGLADQFAKAGLQLGEKSILGKIGLGGTAPFAPPNSGGSSSPPTAIWGPVDKATGGILSQLFGGSTSKNNHGLLTTPGILTPNDQANLAGFDPSELTQLATGGLKAATGETGALGGLLGGSGPNGSEMNPLYVIPAGASLAGSGGGLSSLLDNSGGDASSGIGGFMATLLPFLPHFAAGGDIDGPSVVGENGPEVFNPHGSGTIIPNGHLNMGGGGNTYIDARGSDNSAATEMRVKRAANEARLAGARDGARLSRESRRRVPNSRAFAT